MPKIEQEFCYIKLTGATYILHTRKPFLVGRVWQYSTLPALNELLETINPLAYAQMQTHCIAITLWAVLDDRLMVHSGTKTELQQVINKMLEWYEKDAVEKSKSYFDKKFRIQ